jgi:hypothetical protein
VPNQSRRASAAARCATMETPGELPHAVLQPLQGQVVSWLAWHVKRSAYANQQLLITTAASRYMWYTVEPGSVGLLQ